MPTKTKNFLRPVTRTTLTADICRQLLSHLMRGDWREGDRLPPERELCERLGVGRPSLREALKALEIIGMIESRSGGTFVCSRSEFLSRPLLWAIAGSAQTDTYQLLEARIAIELELVDLAAQRATSQDLDAIANQLHVMETALQGTPFLEADLAFHIAVGEAAHNDILLNALLLIRNLIHQWIERTLKLEGIAFQALEQHRAIHRAIAAKDRDSARTAMRNHLDVTASLLMQAQRAAMAFQSPANPGISDSLSGRLIDYREGHAAVDRVAAHSVDPSKA